MHPLLHSIVDEWFLLEPALFATYFSHKEVINSDLMVPFRVGRMRLEYNPTLLDEMHPEQVEALLRYEMIRILLGHPYQRQPFNAEPHFLTLASNYTIWGNYSPTKYLITPNRDYERGLSFEEYYALICSDFYFPSQNEDVANGVADENCEVEDKEDTLEMPLTQKDAEGESDMVNKYEDKTQASGEESNSDVQGGEIVESEGCGGSTTTNSPSPPNNRLKNSLKQASELWSEDELAQEQMLHMIGEIAQTESWGSLSGNLVNIIKASLVVKVDYRKILSLFRASVMCSKRHLTRMLPSRRYGFEFMGSRRDFATSLLVAIDVSGSVNDKKVEVALGVVNSGFRYGVERVDIVQFDTEIKGKVIPLSKRTPKMRIEGRGGTNFQPVVDYFAQNSYDGLLIITDGYAEEPHLPKCFRGRILWMLYNDSAYNSANRNTLPESLQWIAQMPLSRSRYLILPSTG